MTDRWLNAERAAEYIGVSAQTFRRLVLDGTMPEGRRLTGRLVRYDREAIDQAMGSAALPAVSADEAIERKKARQADAGRRDRQGLRVSA